VDGLDSTCWKDGTNAFSSSAINPCTTTSASTMSAPQAWFADSVPQLLPGFGAPLMLLFRQMKFVKV